METNQVKDEITQTLDHLFVEQADNIENAVRSLKVIAHPVRLKILCVLKDSECTVQALEKYVGVAQATLSQHLSLLKDRGILVSSREGHYSVYRLANEQIADLFEMVRYMYCS
ncbi:MAG: metalloregulator ArsR/SmtB family transcription factor [bacterium]